MKRKILKIIQVVYDILSLGFIIFISIALAVAPKVDGQVYEDSPSTLVETKHKSNAIVGGSRTASFSTDFISNDFLSTLIVTTNITSSYSNNSSDDTKTFFIGEGFSGTEPKYPRVGSYNKINYDNMTLNGKEGVDYVYLDNITIKVVGYGQSSLYYYYFLVNFNDSLNDPIFHFYVALFSKTRVVDSLDDNSLSFERYSITIDQPIITNNFAVVYTNEGLLYDVLNAFKNDNYKKGFDLGKETGYKLGYVAGSNSLDYNVFNVMGQAFGSIANIFNVELLPGFPLWILVFAPLIVAVVIVVVKMIKG